MTNRNREERPAFFGGRWNGLSSCGIKMVGIITMFIDHIAASPMARVMLSGGYTRELYNLYNIMRAIGRISFPIFCFTLVEGFAKTKNRTKYAMRLGLFALLSEIPFDLAFNGRVLEFEYNNVIFTFFLSFLALCVYDSIAKLKLPQVVILFLDAAVLAVFMKTANFLETDYSGTGILTVTAMYFLRFHRLASMTAGCTALAVMNQSEYPAFLALIPMAGYNGKRGWNLKYFFYIFYPAHLLLMWFISVLMGTGDMPVFG